MRTLLLISCLFAFLAHLATPLLAQPPVPGFTLIINQVRGESCCSPGSADHLAAQIETLNNLTLPASFALRYDALTNQKFIDLAKQNQNFEYAAFLEIIPELADDAQVEYRGSAEFWYEAQSAYLIGYTQEERAKLLDTYLMKFRETFGAYPTTTVAWMIDAWSLRYLKEKYGVQVHQLTREQYGTDSYALYGGPPHYPYWPTDNWALIPVSGVSETMPLIVRQTITDPVHNYGDPTNTYTSQPNDYLGREGASFSYFTHLFYQAHRQDNEYTFALLGLENSMAEVYQTEFARQLAEVKKWADSAESNRVVTARDFSTWLSQQPQTWPKVYHGQDQVRGEKSQAWWVTTPTYRARLRLDNQELYLSDLRVYDPSFTDPYLTYAARNLGWWIVPFVLDGSRFFENDREPEFTDIARDNLYERKAKDSQPTRLLIFPEKITGMLVERRGNPTFGYELYVWPNSNLSHSFVFSSQRFDLEQPYQAHLTNSLISPPISDLKWLSNQVVMWGFKEKERPEIFDDLGIDSYVLESTVSSSLNLNQIRQEHYPLLFPELIDRPIDARNTHVYTNNQYAIAGRNPVRLVLFPRDHYNFPTQISYDPTVSTETEIETITIKRQHGNNGMIFIDFESAEPRRTEATITLDTFTAKIPIYFAPNCKQKIVYCLTHPHQAWWYLQSILADRQRASAEKNQ